MDQKIAVTLLPRKPPSNPEVFARALLTELKGCTVVAVEPAAGAVVVTMTIDGIDAAHTTAELTSSASALSIVCDRSGVKLDSVRRIKTDGVYDEVSRVLGRMSGGG